MIFSGLSCPPKNNQGKDYDFFTKSIDSLTLCKSSMFWIFIKVVFSGLKTNHFFLEYQKTIFSGWMCPNIHLRKSLIFWEKEWTQNNFGKILIFWYFFKSLLFKCKSHSFLSGISENDLLLLDLKKKHLRKSSSFWRKAWTYPFWKILIFWSFFKSLL